MTAPARIVFLIDEQVIMNEKVQINHLKISIMRTLLYYRSQQQPILWSYRFFSTQARYTANSIRHFHTMNKDSFDSIDTEYQKRNASRPDAAALGSPIMRIKQVLKEAIGDFQWENTDLCTSDPAQNYMFLITSCPSDSKDMHRFFVNSTKQEGTKVPYIPAHLIPTHFQFLKEELSSTLLQSYKQKNISLSIVDCSFKCPNNNSRARWIDQIIHQGFVSCFEQFGGTHILHQKLIRRYDMYGHSFISEFANILPSQQLPLQTLTPAWRGPFKTKLGKSLGVFSLYPSLHRGAYQSSALTFISEIRTSDVIHASQFSLSWLQKRNQEELDTDYKLTYEGGESSNAFNIILDELHYKQSILIAEMVPMAGHSKAARLVCIEPISRTCASLRFLAIDSLPPTLNLEDVMVDENYPVGTYLSGTKLQDKFTEAPISSEERTYKVDTALPSFLKKVFCKTQPDPGEETKVKTKHDIHKKRKTIVEKSTIQLPADAHTMRGSLKNLYLDVLYAQKETMDDTVAIIDSWIHHLLSSNCTKQEVTSALLDCAMLLADLEIKHNDEIPSAKQMTSNRSNTVENSYQREWWEKTKSAANGSDTYEKMSCVMLKLREAQLQTIIYCFVCKLAEDQRCVNAGRDPFGEVERFFAKVVVLFSMNNIYEFLTEIDAENGPQAAKARDPCDLTDQAFVQVLERRFYDLPELIASIKESAGADDMASSPSSQSSADEAMDIETPEPEEISLPDPIERHVPTDTHIVKPHHPSQRVHSKPLPRAKLEPKTPKSILPQKITRSSSNTLDSFLKRMVDVKAGVTTSTEMTRGEATKAMMAKVSRATVNGRPTMKRSGSFTKSALSPRRPKRTVSMLSHQDTGTVVLRRDNTIPNPKTTPRTSLNRYLNTNLFTDYSEACRSPSSQAMEEDSNILQVASSPQGTSTRFRKLMLDRSPHRHEEGGSSEFSVVHNSQEQHPLYTPRTAARRERDRIERSQIVTSSSQSLAMKLQDMLDEDNEAKAAAAVKRKRGVLYQDDGKESDEERKSIVGQSFGTFNLGFSDEDSNEDEEEVEHRTKRLKSVVVNVSRPVVKRSNTIDDLFNDSFEATPFQFDEEEDEDEMIGM